MEAELKSQLATITVEAQSNSQEWDTSRKQLEGIIMYIHAYTYIYVFINNCGNDLQKSKIFND